jgi:DNA-binding transcriptional ArsR family regulator
MSPARSGAAAPSDSPDPADAVLRALADPHRRQILRLVRGGELAAGEITSHFDATQQAVSHHLQVLAKAGLITERREGQRRLYALDPYALDPVREILTELWPSALQRLKRVVEEDQKKQHAGQTKKAGRKRDGS